MSMFNKLFKGYMLVELLVTMGIAAIIFPALLTGFIASREGKPQQKQRMQAITLLKETEAAAASVKDMNWTLFATFSATPHHPVIYNGRWALVPGAETINGFTRQLIVNNVYRNVVSEIVPFGTPGAWEDPSTKQVTITISWNQPFASSISSSVYLARSDSILYSPLSFGNGLLNHTQIASPSGYIVLENNQKGKWCSPAFAQDPSGNDVSINLPDGPPVAVAASSAASPSIPNDVFVATAPDTTSSVKLAYITTTANTSTPEATLRGIFTLDPAQYSNPSYVPSGINIDNNFKTNDVQYYKSPSGKTYALMATNLPDKEIVAVRINNGSGDDFQDPTNKIYKYWTFFNTRINNKTYNNKAYNSPSANAAVTTSAGDNNGFSSAANAYGLNGSSASDTNSGSNTGTSCTGNDKDKHVFYNFNYNVPSGASIDGIEVRLVARADSTSNSPRMCVQLSWDGGTTWSSTIQQTNNLTTTLSSYTLGGPTDTWGRAWSDSNFSNSNFRLRITNVSSSTSRDFYLDWVGAKVFYNGNAETTWNDQAPFSHGATTLTTLGSTGYVASGGYLYVFDLSNIDSMTDPERINTGLPIKGCRIQLNGFECTPGYGTDRKYGEGEAGETWTSYSSPAHPTTCADGGNIELYSTNDIYPVKVGANTYIYTAIGAGTMPEFEIADVSTVPSASRSEETSCGRGADSGWRITDTIDFYAAAGEEAANSVFAKSDGTRAYITSNGGGDSKQFYVINTTNKSDIRFLSGTSSPPTSGFYYGSSPNDELFVRRSLTVLNGERAVLVGSDGYSNSDDAQEYQVVNMSTPNSESAPAYCGGLNYNQGFNDLTSVSEADGDNFVYMVTNTNEKQLKIIQGGPDGTYVGDGDYTSAPIDVGYSTTFNNFIASVSASPTSSINFQFAAADTGGDGTCASSSYVFTGPDGNTSTYYATTSAAIWLGNPGNGYKNPARCLKYKAYFSTTDYNFTPELEGMTINYSP